MKVLLVYPNLHGMNMLPPAISLFTAILKQEGHEVRLFDTTNWLIPDETFDSDKEKEKLLTARPYDDSKLWSEMRHTDVFEDFRALVDEFQPGLLAVSVNEDQFPIARNLLAALGERRVPTVMGGVFATFAPEKCLALPGVDMVCIGEGEEALRQLCRALEHGAGHQDIPGLWFKTGGGIRKNPMAAPVNMDDNPLPDLSLFDESRLYRPMQGRVWRMLPVETHRGCPYQCTYCNTPAQKRLFREATGKNFYRKKSFAAVRKELLFYKQEMQAEALYFWADTFLSYTEQEFEQFCEIYEDIRLPFWMQSRPETIHSGRIKRLMDLGLFRMSLGVEHGNEHFRKTVLRRNVKNAAIVENLARLNALGLKYSVNNIIGFPDDTRELSMDTIRLNREIGADSANAYSFSPFHGTPLRAVSEAKGYCDKELIARSAMKPTLLNMPQFPAEAIEGLRRCFTLYVRMPVRYWDDIRRAEALTPEGDRVWENLRNECLEHYVPRD